MVPTLLCNCKENWIYYISLYVQKVSKIFNFLYLLRGLQLYYSVLSDVIHDVTSCVVIYSVTV